MFKIQTHYKVIAIALFVLALSFVSGGKANAASLTVNSTADTTADDGACTLREAITSVNSAAVSGATPGECVAGDGVDDTINLPVGTITLGSSLPQMSDSVSINGQGISQTVVNGADSEVFENTGSGYDVSIFDLKIVAGRGSVIDISDVNLTVLRVEVDKTGGSILAGYGVESVSSDGGTYDVSFQDVYVHDVPSDGNSTNGISIGTITGSTINLSMDRVTVSDIDSVPNVQGIVITTGFSNFALTPGTVNADLQNITVTNINSSAGQASGILLGSGVNGGEVSTVAVARNITISDLSGLGSAALAVLGIAVGNNDTATTILNMTNGLIDGACAVSVPSIGPPTDGTHNLELNSLGGNVSGDPTCAPYFTQPTDQNNLTNIASTLGTLSDNGGYVPTLPLLENSPAVDAGVSVSGLTTDARLAARPQGSAFDSGAYESPYTKPAAATASLADTGQNTTTFATIAITMLTLAAGAIVFRRFSNN